MHNIQIYIHIFYTCLKIFKLLRVPHVIGISEQNKLDPILFLACISECVHLLFDMTEIQIYVFIT